MAEGSVSPRSPRRVPRGPARALLFLVLSLGFVVFVAPLVALLVEVVRGLPAVVEGLSSSSARDALTRTLLVAVLVVPLQTALGVAGGIVLVRHRFVGRGLLDALSELPLSLSPVMAGLAILLVFGSGGLLAGPLATVGVQTAFALPAVVFATAFVTVPFVVRETVLALEALGDSEEQAAATLGATPWQTFWRVTLPNLREALVPGVALTTARCLGEFGAALVVGGAITHRTETATTWLHHAIEGRQEPAAYGMALVLLAGSIGALVALRRVKEGAWESR